MSWAPPHNTKRRYVFGIHGRSRPFGWLERQHRREASQPATSPQPSFERIIAAENLLAVWDRCRRQGGQAAGADGLTYSDFSRTEAAEVLRQVSRAIREGRYCPYAARTVRIDKPDGGVRGLEIGLVVDRVVARAVLDALNPVLDPVFLPRVYGFRRGRSPWQMLLAIERRLLALNSGVIATADVRLAFPSIRQALALEAFARRISDERILRLIEVVLRGDNDCDRGLPQGLPPAPLAASLVLHDLLDEPFQSRCQAAFFRWADDLAVVSSRMYEARDALAMIADLLRPAGLELKPNARVVNLTRQGAHADLLGFSLHKSEDRLQLGLRPEAWTRLSEALVRVGLGGSAASAQQVVASWVAVYAPGLVGLTSSDVITRVRQIAAGAGQRELGRPEDLQRTLARAAAGWSRTRVAFHLTHTEPAGLDDSQTSDWEHQVQEADSAPWE